MTYHICAKCGKSFNKKHGLKYHTDNNVCNNKKHECRYCNNRFSTSNAMYKHIKSYCKVKKQEDVTKEDILERLRILWKVLTRNQIYVLLVRKNVK